MAKRAKENSEKGVPEFCGSVEWQYYRLFLLNRSIKLIKKMKMGELTCAK